MRKSKGKYWYKEGNKKLPFDKCSCGNFKCVHSKKCFSCSGVKKDGTFNKKKDSEKKTKNQGYVLIFKPKHKRSANFGYVFEHIVVIEDYLSRELNGDEVVHHINGIRDDNRIENLKVMTKSEHNVLHNPKTKHLNKNYYGKMYSHARDKCSCGNWKDKRSKRCIHCARTSTINKKFKVQEDR